MNQDDREKTMYANADKFINLANELVKSDESGGIGVAIRYAAARYSAFEASMRTSNLAEEKDTQLELFSKEFKNMLQINIEDYARRQSQN
jgi:Protein of unknown function (DUF3144)